MKHFEILEHTADIRLKLQASSLEELFVAALEGMSSIMKPDKLPTSGRKHELVKINAHDTTALLIDFLSEVLTFSAIHKAIYDKIAFTHLSETHIEATIQGEVVDSFDEDIKAVTYHEAYVRKNIDDSYEAMIIFDI